MIGTVGRATSPLDRPRRLLRAASQGAGVQQNDIRVCSNSVGTVGEQGILTSLFVVTLMAAALIGLIISGALETRRRERIQKGVVEKTNSALEKHFDALTEQRTQLSKDKWPELVRYFIIDHVRPLLSQDELLFFTAILQPLL
jgi:hypothetical protein